MWVRDRFQSLADDQSWGLVIEKGTSVEDGGGDSYRIPSPMNFR